MDDSEKDELKSTLYDNNANSNTTGLEDSITSSGSSSTGRNNNYKNSRTPGRVSRGGGFASGQTNLNRNQQPITYRPTASLASSGSSCPTSGSNYVSNNKVSRPKPTTWVTNRKFQLQSSASSNTSSTHQPSSSINKTNTTVVASKRYAYQHQQQQQQPLNHKSTVESQKYNNNSGSGVSDNFSSTEYNHHHQQQHQNQGSNNKNRSNIGAKRNYDVNLDGNNSAKTVPNTNNPQHCRTNSANSSYSTDSTSVDYSCDETSYGKTFFFTWKRKVSLFALPYFIYL